MCKLPFYKTIPYRNLNFNQSEPPFPQDNGEEWSIENRVMSDYDLFVCEEGSAEFHLGDEHYHLETGMALLVPPHCLINARKSSVGNVRMVAQHFMLYIFQSSDFFSHIQYRKLISFSNPQFILSLCSEIRSIMNRGLDKWNPIDTNPVMMLILSRFIEEAYMEAAERDQRKSSLVLNLIDKIEQEYTSKNLLDQVMSLSDYGYSHTSNLFKDYTGLSIKAYIIERKMEAAKAVLLRKGSIREAAAAAGYDDEFYFSRIFKKYTNTSPRDFRNRI